VQFRIYTQPVPLKQVKVPSLRIPEAAWDHLVNGKSALDWVMERQTMGTDKASGIFNDANDWAMETMGNLSLL
jgi:predicted helicase